MFEEYKRPATYKEHFDSPQELDRKTTLLAEWIRASKHFIAFTGAGISTSCGIADYRSGPDTVMDTGVGAWAAEALNVKQKNTEELVHRLSAIPSLAHLALTKLFEEKVLKFVISQNTDGLHFKSGIAANCLCELHGNCNIEYCEECHIQYNRDYEAVGPKRFEHYTGRTCTAGDCPKKGVAKLRDTIVEFGECLLKGNLESSLLQTCLADLCLAMGSSLVVTPAAEMAEVFGDSPHKRLVIVNLQKTQLDVKADLRINGKCDEVMKLVMQKLGLEVPELILRRRVSVAVLQEDDESFTVIISSMDQDYRIMSLFSKVQIVYSEQEMIASEEPFEFWVGFDDDMAQQQELKITLTFMRHYNEPDLTFCHTLSDSNSMEKMEAFTFYGMQFNTKTQKWTVPEKEKIPEV